MRQIGDFIGGIISLFFLGAIVFGAFSSGNTGAIIFVLIIGLLIYIAVKREDRKLKEQEEKRKAEAKAAEEERKKKQKIEAMSESEFISFVKYSYDEFDEHFKIEGVGGGHGIETKVWSTDKYKIVSEIDTNNFNDFISIYRKKDGQKIFSGCWGSGDDE
jgi:hypothetical protein